MWDFTCRDTLAASHVVGTSREIGKGAVEAEASKLALYKELVNQYDVIPVAMETFGSWGLKLLGAIRPKIHSGHWCKNSTIHR